MWMLLLLPALAAAVRLPGLDRPLSGNFATKNVVYAMAARNWAEGRAPLWQPTIDCLTDGERSWHLMEYPASALVTAAAWRMFGGSLDVWGRLTAIAWSCLAVVCAYRLGRRWFGEVEGRVAGLVMAFAPVGIIYGQSFMLEASVAALSLVAVDVMDVWRQTRKWLPLLITALAASLVVATKVYMAILVVPLAAVVLLRRPDSPALSRRELLAMSAAFACALAPTIAWYGWVASVDATAGPAVDFHPRSRATIHDIPHPLLGDPQYYGRLLYHAAGLMLTPLGLAAACIGACDRRFRRALAWLAVSLGLWFALPLKFHHANYYFLVVLPPAALAAGVGWRRLRDQLPLVHRLEPAAALVTLAIVARLSIGPAFNTPDEDRSVPDVAAAARQASSADDKIATLHGSTIDVLYYCDRTGWAFDVDDPNFAERLIVAQAGGAKVLAVADVDRALSKPHINATLNALPVLASGDDWTLYRLAPPTNAESRMVQLPSTPRR